MKIAIIADTHNNETNIRRIVDWLNKEKIPVLLHCGDISSKESLDLIRSSFLGEAKFVSGNADFNLSLPDFLEVGKIAFCHKPDLARSLAESGKYDIVFYGHTHQPWEEKVGNCRLVNPGEAAGQLNKATFALYDGEKDLLELKILERM